MTDREDDGDLGEDRIEVTHEQLARLADYQARREAINAIEDPRERLAAAREFHAELERG